MQRIFYLFSILVITSLSCGAPVTETPSVELQLQTQTQIPNLESKALPNIILVIADDMGIDSSPCYQVGTEKPNMPNLEALCSSGLVFDNVWATPSCSSTRAAILSGEYGLHNGVFAAGDKLEDTESVFDVLTSASYSNAVIGKWHVGGRQPDPTHPSLLGVEHYAGFLTSSLRDYYEWEITENGVRSPVNGYATTVFTDKAIAWIQTQDSPWFLWLAYNAPHTPNHVPPSDLHTQQGLTGTQRDMRQNTRSYYFAALEALDSEMGRLLESMSPETRANTIIIFIGDNGSPDNVSQAFPPEQTKFTVYEGGIHVPMIIAGNGVTRVGEREDALINITDLFATIAEIAGISGTTHADSISFADAFSNSAFTGRDYAYSEYRFEDGSTAWTVRNHQYKVIEYSDGRKELYDLFLDPFEYNDLLINGISEELEAVIVELENFKSELQP